MKIGKNGLDLIKKYEGLQLNAYRCPANLVTIGYGCTFYEDGSKIKMGDVITPERADKLLINVVSKFESIVNKKINIPLTQNQFDALVSHTFNTGGSSTLFDLVNKKSPDDVIKNWFETKYISANGKPLPGLIKRRKEECNLYFKK